MHAFAGYELMSISDFTARIWFRSHDVSDDEYHRMPCRQRHARAILINAEIEQERMNRAFAMLIKLDGTSAPLRITVVDHLPEERSL